MIRMLRFQLRNCCRQSVYYIYMCTSVILLMLPLLMSEADERLRLLNHQIRLVAGLGLFGVISICIFANFDSDNGTVKNIIVKGYDKVKLLFSKYIIGLIIGAFFILMQILAIFVYAKFYSLELEGLWQNVGCGLICMIPTVLFYITVCVLFGKSKYSIPAAFLIQTFVPLGLHGIVYLLKTDIPLQNYWVGNDLIKLDMIPQIITVSIYTIVITMLGIFIARRKEIK